MGIGLAKEIDMNVMKMLVCAGEWVAARIYSLSGNGWDWVGDDAHPVLFEKRSDHDEFFVVARIGIDEDTPRNQRFSDVFVPGAVLLPARWKNRVDEDIQWYVPRRHLHFGFQTGGAVGELVKSVKRLYEHIEADIQILTGERPLYLIEVEVFYRGECLAIKAEHGLAISIDENTEEADEITASLIADAVNVARNTWTYRSMVFSAA